MYQRAPNQLKISSVKRLKYIWKSETVVNHGVDDFDIQEIESRRSKNSKHVEKNISTKNEQWWY